MHSNDITMSGQWYLEYSASLCAFLKSYV